MAKELDKWKDRINLSNRKFKPMENKIKRWRGYYRGDQWAPLAAGITDSYRDKVVDNMVFSNIRTMMPSINFKNPRIFCQAKKKPYKTKDGLFDTLASSAILEMLLNYYYKHLEVKRETDKCLLDAFLGPWGICRIGYTLATEKFKEKDRDGELIEVNELIKEDSPYVKRISPMDFRVDVEAKDSHLQDASWVSYKWIKSLDDVKANPEYENTGNLKPNVKVEPQIEGKGETVVTVDKNIVSDSQELERVQGWDIWDKKTHKIFTFVDNHKKFLREKEWPLEFDGFDCEILYFNENPDEIFPVSDVEIMLKAQDELNRIRSLQLSHIRNVSNRKYVAQKTKWEKDELDKVTHGPDGIVALCETSPVDALIPVKDANMSQDIYIVQKGLRDAIRESMGIAQYERGVTQKFDTATEPELIAQGVSIQRSERLGIFENFVKSIVKKLAQTVQQSMDKMTIPLNEDEFKMGQQYAVDKLEKIVGTDGNTMLYPWLNVEKDDIMGDYDFNIEVGSTQPINQEKRKKDALILYQIAMQNPNIDGHESTKRLFEAFEVRDIEKLIKQKEVVAQEGMQRTRMGIQVEQAKDAPKHQVDLAKTKMKSDTAIKTALIKVMGTAGQKAAGGEK
ncbi:MAG: hypothetical protein KGJ89_04970 [Patescibacteria group bacterium]|nr:hypothetical protein [Patescibacteria group bacterium]MDE2227273.1 hypothetical protein [Patescibacteria group bacterium]